MENFGALQRVLKELGNLFQEERADHKVLDTKTIADPMLAGLVGTHQERGNHNSSHLRTAWRLTIQNKVAFFTHDKVASSSKEKVMKEECQLFYRLFISCQVRHINLEEFFKHENQEAPASLSDNGKLHTSQKSQSQSGLTLPEREPEGGRWIRRRVTGTTKTPQSWRSFLRDDSNKTELFNFLADKMCDADTTSTIIVTRGDNAICNKVRSVDAVAPCSHEEADTRVFVHARAATSLPLKQMTLMSSL